ncbi:ABC transporter permease [Desertihabitans aurantiacus]|uniref:ABC transporter permease n=1 Tax=Desertihabitans aurantiacus TaxID=2282477 RepID=UPI000DF7DA0C|nr:ABC transporter permease [Desertihabitans aurantiacus]
MNLTYALLELQRTLRIWSSTVFSLALPMLFFLVFGAMVPWGSVRLAHGDVAAQTMISLATYGAITAAAGMAGSAALEQHQGWGRQLALTPMTRGGFVRVKVFVALVVAALPVAGVFGLGALTGAGAEPRVWVLSPVLILLGSVVFACYGVAVGKLFRSEAAVGAASGLLVVLAFLGGAFVPLTGWLLDIARFTPVYGVMALARYPLTDGATPTLSGELVQDPLWLPVVNVGAWTLVLGALAVLAARRGTRRA